MKIQSTALFFAISAIAFGQQYETTRARITGGGGDQGKCSFEVQVDGTVDVEIASDQARARALSGASPQWRKMECNMALPTNPGQFAFNPQGGRGKQTLALPPNDNRGVALVKLEDSQGGSDTYRFELTWRGTAGPQYGQNVPGRGGSRGGSIFDQPGDNSFPNNNNGGFPNNGGANRNDRVNFRGTGDGYLRMFRGSDDSLGDGQVNVDQQGRVTVSLNTRANGRLQLSGQVVLTDGDRLVANMNGGTMQGTMEILLDSRNRVQELAMVGVGRNRFDLRWQPR